MTSTCTLYLPFFFFRLQSDTLNKHIKIQHEHMQIWVFNLRNVFVKPSDGVTISKHTWIIYSRTLLIRLKKKREGATYYLGWNLWSIFSVHNWERKEPCNHLNQERSNGVLLYLSYAYIQCVCARELFFVCCWQVCHVKCAVWIASGIFTYVPANQLCCLKVRLVGT